ncbi:MAG: hypothetical protein N2039_05245, partial [Gemmataceae bacterium]|nr:hypothetical protein [Gemmataceae bacterium]
CCRWCWRSCWRWCWCLSLLLGLIGCGSASTPPRSTATDPQEKLPPEVIGDPASALPKGKR